MFSSPPIPTSCMSGLGRNSRHWSTLNPGIRYDAIGCGWICYCILLSPRCATRFITHTCSERRSLSRPISSERCAGQCCSKGRHSNAQYKHRERAHSLLLLSSFTHVIIFIGFVVVVCAYLYSGVLTFKMACFVPTQHGNNNTLHPKRRNTLFSSPSAHNLVLFRLSTSSVFRFAGSLYLFSLGVLDL